MTSGSESDEGVSGYPVPAPALHRVELTVRRSRFIASIAPAANSDRARAFIHSVEAEFPDATHHCWGFVAGPPGTTAHVGLSDAGEPHGTAGRPILETLLHSDVGEVVAVVTRYFGGVKLGRGGLGRAYAGAVAKALESLPTRRRIERVPVRIRVPFRAADALFRFLDQIEASGRDERYGATGLEVAVRVPAKELERLEGEVAGFTSGEGSVRPDGSGGGART